MSDKPSGRCPEVPAAPDVETGSVSYARRFQGRAGSYILARQAEAARALLADFTSCTCLDVGGGHGQLLNVYRSLDMSVTVAGSSKDALAMVSSDPDIDRQICVLTELPFPDKSFDVVVSLRLLTHLPNWPCALAEMCRVARRGVLVDYPPFASLNFFTPLVFWIKKLIEGDTRVYTVIRRKEIRRALEKSGYQFGIEERQFLLPLGVHRLTNSPDWFRFVERFAKKVRLTQILGGPALLLARPVQE
jgi:ubiquinone/menaquinone biosynthesis C-methylase UbiE